MSASVQATGAKGDDFSAGLRLAADETIASLPKLQPVAADVMEAAVQAAFRLARKAPRGSIVTADIQMQEDPLNPAGFTVSVLVSSSGPLLNLLPKPGRRQK